MTRNYKNDWGIKLSYEYINNEIKFLDLVIFHKGNELFTQMF